MSLSVTTVISCYLPSYPWVYNSSLIWGKLSRIRAEKMRLISLKCQKVKLTPCIEHWGDYCLFFVPDNLSVYSVLIALSRRLEMCRFSQCVLNVCSFGG